MSATALVLVLDDLDPTVAGLRRRLDPAAHLAGLPPHLPVLDPFVDTAGLEPGVLEAAAALASASAPPSFTLTRVEHDGDTVWLAPEPVAPLRDLARRARDRFTHIATRSGGDAPHLTVARPRAGETADGLAVRVAAELTPVLPVRCSTDELWLLVEDGAGTWNRRAAFPFAGAEPGDDPVALVEPDPSWPLRYAEERDRIVAALGDRIREVHHIGSTAVAGMPAKPVIDILAVVDDLDAAWACVPALLELDYHHPAGYRDAPGAWELWFCRPGRRHRTHHLHLAVAGHPEWRRRLLFRDALRADPRAARDYAALKRDLARRHPTDREAYTDAKGSFVAALVERAEREEVPGLSRA